jgi:hypothetical protein
MKARRKLYQRKPVLKISQMQRRLYQKRKEGTKKQEEDKMKGLQYKSRLAGAHAKEANENDEAEAGTSTKKQASWCCSHCQSFTHLRQTGRLWAMNPKNIAAKER